LLKLLLVLLAGPLGEAAGRQNTPLAPSPKLGEVTLHKQVQVHLFTGEVKELERCATGRAGTGDPVGV
jgi:hypothetical protein